MAPPKWPPAAPAAVAARWTRTLPLRSPPAAYEAQVLDHRSVVDAVEKKYGKMIPLALKSTFNPRTGKYFAFSDSFVPDPGNYRTDLWAEVGYPKGPDTWDDLRVGGRQIKDRFGNPVGTSLAGDRLEQALLAGWWPRRVA